MSTAPMSYHEIVARVQAYTERERNGEQLTVKQQMWLYWANEKLADWASDVEECF